MTTDSLVNYTGTISIGGVDIAWQEYLQTLSVEIVSGGAWTAEMTLFDRDGDFLETAIIAAQANRDIDFSFGWDDPSQGVKREFSGFILQYQPEFLPHGTALTLEIIARPAGPMLLNKQVRSFPEGKRASEIVEEIAAANGWPTTDINGRATIERTEPPLETPFNSKGESDLKFIRDQILKQAVNQQGASGYIALFDERGAFHFRTPDFISAETHLYRYARDGAGEVIRFAPQDTAIFGVLNGGGNTRFTSATSLQGGTAEQNSTVGGGIDGRGTPTVVDSAAKANLGNGTHSIVNLNVRNPEEVTRIARARYETFRRYAFQGSLQVHGTHRVRLIDFIDFEFIKESGELHYLSGNFRVFKLKHSLGNGVSWTTEFDVLRDGIPVVSGAQPLVVSETVTPQVADPGDGSVGIPVES